jgi:hypothetical protein
MGELVRADDVRRLFGAIERDCARAIAGGQLQRGSHLVRLRVLLVAAMWAELPIHQTIRQVVEVLDHEPPLLR